ncbi:MAG TPA: choice-of-anchor B family protein [Longimicrobiales bacterium]|nr:choice-of-anchor B family protein [Longimicrobiales bacterium]
MRHSLRSPSLPRMAALLGLIASAAAALAVPEAAAGQDRIGAGVAVVGGDIVALKPTSTRGAPHLLVFRHDGQAWTLARRLPPARGGLVGEALGASLAVDGSAVIAAAGDADGRWAFHDWRLREDGSWSEAGRVLLDPDVAAPDPTAPLDVGRVFQILQPPPRTVAAGYGLAAAVRQNAQPLAVSTYERSGPEPGDWTPSGAVGLGAETPAPVIPALGPDGLLVGVPLAGAGAVRAFARDGDAWVEGPAVTPPDMPDEARFGAALVMADDRLFVGAPGWDGGRVLAFERTEDGWRETARLASPDGGAAYGAALAVRGDRLLVADPRAEEGRGSVHAYRRGDDGSWTAASRIAAPMAAEGDLFGAALALGDAPGGVIGVAGAPGVWANLGAAYALRPDGADELDHGLTLDAVQGGVEIRCEAGTAAGFSCAEVDLQAFLTLSALGARPGERVSDLWGWTDPETGREYALIGRTSGVQILDVTSPTAPLNMGIVEANPSGARDIKVYADHMFFTGDGAGAHGLIVFDLARLRDLDGPAGSLRPDAVYDGIASAHNLIIDTESGFAFAVSVSAGGETCGGGLHMVDIREPTAPTFAGCYTDTHGLIFPGRTHDAQCVVYRGPDEEHQGKQICFASNETALRIVDVSDKANPVPISAADYPARAYIHQGWLTDDQRYFYLDDEIDELTGKAERTRTTIWDVTDLDDPVMAGEFLGPDNATDHNLYIKGDRMYQANYQAGLRVVDISDPLNPIEVGHFDTTPYEGEGSGLSGAWSAYPFFESGTVVVTSMNEGVFILRPRRAGLIP